MNVLHVVHWPRSGIGVVVRDIVRHSAPDIAHTVLCLAEGEPVTSQLRDAGARVVTGEGNGWTSWAREFRRSVGGSDLVHTHSLTPRVLAAALAKDHPQVTTVHTAYLYFHHRGFSARVKRFAECFIARATSAPYVCVAQTVASSLPCNAMTQKAMVIHNGVDLDRTLRLSEEPVDMPPVGAPLLVAVGRLDWEKGFDRLLRAVAQVRQDGKELGLILCGDGRERGALEHLAGTLGIRDAVHFCGHVPNPMPYLRGADVYVSSSLQEGFSLTVAEAMVLCCPVVATPVPGLATVMRDGQDIFLARGFEATDIAGAVQRAISDRDRLKVVAESGRQRAVKDFDVTRVAGEYEQLYRDVLAARWHSDD